MTKWDKKAKNYSRYNENIDSFEQRIFKTLNSLHVNFKNKTLLDVGCGSGILGIAAMKLGAIVDACDTDPISVSNAVENAKINNLEFASIWEGSSSLAKKSYDVVVANIVADVLTFIAKELKSALKEDGVLILSGILDKYETKVLNFYKDCEVLERIVQDEWVTLIVKKR